MVAPVGLWFRFGHWYLVAWDVEREGVRTFRVDRIDGDVTRGETGSGTVPDGVQVDVKAALPDEPWEAEGDDAVAMRVRVDALEARRVIDEVGEDKVVARADDGSVVLVPRRVVVHRHPLVGARPARSRHHLGSTGLPRRARCVARRHSPTRSTHFRRIRWCPPRPMRAAPARRPGPDPPPEQRRAGGLRRLLAVIGWLAQVGEAPTAEAARRFGMDEQELVAELELAACCGTPPYTPDTLMEIEVSEHSVRGVLAPGVRPAAAA